MDIEYTLSDLFECGIIAERKARDFYLGLAEKFQSRPQLYAFWKSMAQEEEEHANALQQSRESLPGDRLNSAIDMLILEKTADLYKLSVGELLKSVHNLDEAYLLAQKLESSDINVVFNFLKMNFVGENKLPPGIIECHLQKLLDFRRTFGEIEARKSIVADS